MNEQLNVLRKIAEKGLATAQNYAWCAHWHCLPTLQIERWEEQLDLWQHLLDEIERTEQPAVPFDDVTKKKIFKQELIWFLEEFNNTTIKTNENKRDEQESN